MPYDERDIEIARIQNELTKVRSALAAIASEVENGNYLNILSSRSEDSALGGGGVGGSVMTALMTREKMLMQQLAEATLWDENVEIAIGNDVTGGDQTETNLS